MVEAKVIFTLEGDDITIQCSKEEKMKDICQKFVNKLGKNINTLLFLYGGNQLNFNISFRELVKDEQRNEIKILVYINEKEEFICPKCGEKIKLNKERIDDIILSINNLKGTIDSAKYIIESVIKISSVNNINMQLKGVNLILNSLNEDIKKAKEKVKNLFNDNNDNNYTYNFNNNIIINENNNNFNYATTYQTNNNISLNDDKKKILISLIFLYGNEQEILRLYSQGGVYDLKQYYLINKTIIDKFKEIYNYNEIYNILSQKGIRTLNDTLTNMKNYLSMTEIQSFAYTINIDSYTLSQYNSMPETITIGEYGVYTFPLNFVIIHESLLNSLKKFMKAEANSEYQINFGKTSLCLRRNNDYNKIYIYNYNNSSKNMIVTGVIELFRDAWKDIFDKFLSKNTFIQYLTEQNINFNQIKERQNLLSTSNKHLGYIYLINPLRNSMNENKINEISSNINQNFDDFRSMFQNLFKSLNTLKYNTFELPDIDNIKSYFDNNILIYLPVFVVETRKLNYCLSQMIQTNETNGIKIDFSSVFTENDIISCDKINESKKYSFINEEFCKFFKIQNINNLSKGFLFINKVGSEKKVISIYYQKENKLLKVENYYQNSFKLKKKYY